MSIRLPKQMMVFEDKIRKIIAQQVRRGRIEVSISIAGEGRTKFRQLRWKTSDTVTIVSLFC
ncbi:YicC/YloC family endoribonuclease, partial [Bacillus sp. SS-TM]